MAQDYYSIDEYTQLDAIIRNGGDRIPICFCIDVSNSMSFVTNPPEELVYSGRTGTVDNTSVSDVYAKRGYTLHHRIEELKRVLKIMVNEMKSSPVISEAAIIDVVVFGKFADFVIGPVNCKNLSDAIIDKIVADSEDGGTQTALGIELALEKIDFLTKKIKDAGSASYLPVFILMSDGVPSDAEASVIAAEKLKSRSTNNEMTVIPIAIGAGGDTEWMRSLSQSNRVFRMDYPDDYDAVFQSITKRISCMTAVLPFDAISAEKGNTSTHTENIPSSAYGTQQTDEEIFKELEKIYLGR